MADAKQQKKKEEAPQPLSESEIAAIATMGPYAAEIKEREEDIQKLLAKVQAMIGYRDSDTGSGLSPPSTWDLAADKQKIQGEHPLSVARCVSIVPPSGKDKDAAGAAPAKPAAAGAPAGAAAAGAAAPLGGLLAGRLPGAPAAPLSTDDQTKYVISLHQSGKFVVGLGENVAPTDIEEGMRVGCDRQKFAIQLPLPPKIDPHVTMMTVEEKPDVTYADVGGVKEQLEQLKEVVETPLLHPERFVSLGIDPPKGILLYGPPGTGKTLAARAVANRTEACFIRVIGSELVQRYVGEGARMVRELFQMARQKKACIIFFDEIDAIGGTRFDDNGTGENEVQRTMLELLNQLDGFESRGPIKVLMATNRPDTLDPALLRPGRLDRKVEFGLPDLEGRAQIFKIHARSMNCERGIRFDLLSRLCPNCTGADIRSVCTEAGMFAIRSIKKAVSEKNFLDAINKVIKGYAKFSATPKYMVYN
ncbi:putative 26S proteasome regulatory subunit 7 [Paratrimastix pyriformis]|uniref:26S proteasome regulatory subunit 7 n=1 Tax=Paratrimastix pyriformis TaxID=342808 RepID=A0ABQ8U9I3_9EUKA|nr:putative 26S proteasome regulatory subunit 7 [Paratrimastix pyriformis]